MPIGTRIIFGLVAATLTTAAIAKTDADSGCEGDQCKNTRVSVWPATGCVTIKNFSPGTIVAVVPSPEGDIVRAIPGGGTWFVDSIPAIPPAKRPSGPCLKQSDFAGNYVAKTPPPRQPRPRPM